MAGNDGSVADTERISPSASSVKEGPVLSLLSKRLRALKKKYNKIVQIEESKVQGKNINKEQEEVLKLKPSVAALIDEYEKLREPLSVAVKEELFEHEKELKDAEEKEVKEEEKEFREASLNEEKIIEGSEVSNEKGVSGIVDQQVSLQEPSDVSENVTGLPESSESSGNAVRNEIADILTFLYFAQLFDVRAHGEASSLIWTKVHERSSCLSYDFVTEDSPSPLLETDLDDLALFGSLLTSRAPNATISHKDALGLCINHANNWVQNSDSAIREDLGVTYSHLRERLNRVLSSEYFTMIPELKTVDQQVAAAAVVSGAEQYASEFLIHGASSGEVVPEVAAFLSSQGQGAGQQQLHSQSLDYMHQTTTVDVDSNAFRTHFSINQSETRIGDQIIKIGSHEILESGPSSEECLQEQNAPSVDFRNQEETKDPKEKPESNIPNADVGTRGYQGPKGNGRGYNYGASGRGRGYVNGRGSRGGYGNGRGGQHYDQGGYHPRNNYYARGGGRGSRGGNSFNGYPNAQNTGETTKNIPA